MNNQLFTMDANGLATGQAFLESELEKRDNLIKTPLTSFTYGRDITVRVGGGWDEFVSSFSVSYGIANGSDEGVIAAPGSNGIPLLQANFDKDVYRTHVVNIGTSVKWVDVQRGNATGRNLDRYLTEGVRLVYDKHMNSNVYTGFSGYGTTGLLNNANVAAYTADNGAGGTPDWASKTANEILYDINKALTTAHANAGNDPEALANHILIPWAQFGLLATTPVTAAGSESILDYLMNNNYAAKQGEKVFVGGCTACAGIGTGSTDRMMVYCNKEKYVAVDELSPLSRAMTTQNAATFSYDTAYAANVSEVEFFAPETAVYVDGI